jgi:hypothetical protein
MKRIVTAPLLRGASAKKEFKEVSVWRIRSFR